MVIAIFRSLEGENLEDFSIRLAQKWRIGQKGLDNGVILLVFVQDRKVRLEVGYGLEPIVTDAVAGRIIREVIAPRFREQRYAAGLEGAVDALFSRLAPSAGTPSPPGSRPRSDVVPPAIQLFLALFFLGIAGLTLVLVLREAGRRFYTGSRHGWSSGFWGLPGRGGSGWSGGGSFGGFSGGGGSFGGGGASGGW